MKTAFVLSGGANLGSVQVGMLRALLAADITPDFLVGTSAGAINAAFIAAHPDVAGTHELEAIWVALRRNVLFRARPIRGVLGLLGSQLSLCSPEPLTRVLRANLHYGLLENAAVPVHVVATELTTGLEVLLSSGSVVDAVLASASLPGILPPVRIGGRTLVDGGVTNNAPLAHALHLGADRIYVLSAGQSCALADQPRSAAGVAFQSLSVLIGRQIVNDVDRHHDECELFLVPQLCPVDVGILDFSRAKNLIARGYESTQRWIANGQIPEPGQHVIEPHAH